MSRGAALGAATRRSPASGPVGALTGLLAGLVVLAPWLRPGSLLVRDLVAVRDPAVSLSLIGGAGRLARDVPGEVLAATLGQAVGGDVVVRVALLLACAVAGAGTARLLDDAAPAAWVVAAVAVVANPWTWAYLRQGQWLVLVAFAAVPWVAAAVARDDGWAVARGMAAAAVSGFLAVVVVWPTLLGTGVASRRPRTAAVGIVAGLVAALPWLLLGGPGVVDPDGFVAFAARADTPLGTWGSILSGGGYFNAEVASPWRSHWPVGGLATVLAVVGLVAAATRARRGAASHPRALVGLGVAAAVGVVVAGAGASPVGLRLLGTAARSVPAVAVVRDTHRLLAPLVVVVAVGLGAATATAVRRWGEPVGLSAVAVALVLLALPDPLVGPRLPGPSDLPEAWTRAAAMIDDDPRPGAVVVAPSGQTQRYPFTDGDPVALPLRRLVDRPVVASTSLRVGDLVVEEGPSSSVADLVEAPSDTWDADRFATAGIAWVAVTDPALVDVVPTGFDPVVDEATLLLLRVGPGVASADDRDVPLAVVVIDVMVLIGAVGLWARPRRRSSSGQPREGDSAVASSEPEPPEDLS